jgi:hypothetical protein
LSQSCVAGFAGLEFDYDQRSGRVFRENVDASGISLMFDSVWKNRQPGSGS